MKTLIAKTKVAEVTDFGQNNKRTRLTRPDGTSEENKSFSAYTPQISVEILVNNPDAVDFFQAGEEVYLSFSTEKPSDQNQLLELLKNTFMVCNDELVKLNLGTVITWQLQNAGIKVFKENLHNYCVDLDFLKKQLDEQSLQHCMHIKVGETVNVALQETNRQLELTRLT